MTRTSVIVVMWLARRTGVETRACPVLRVQLGALHKVCGFLSKQQSKTTLRAATLERTYTHALVLLKRRSDLETTVMDSVAIRGVYHTL